MSHHAEHDEPADNSPQPQTELESDGGGAGRSRRTAIGMSDQNHGFDPELLTDRIPHNFKLKRRSVHKRFYNCFTQMPRERAFQIMEACGFTPLCILTVAVRWNMLAKESFDFLDLQAVYETAGYDVSDFGKMLNAVEMQCLYRLDNAIGTLSEEMLAKADLCEFKYG